MGIRSFLSKPFANYVVKQQHKWMQNPVQAQQAIFEHQLKVGRQTQIGDDHHLNDVGSHADYVEAMPVRDYEGLQPYVQQVIDGASDVMWRGRPAYFAKTSGTTSGAKYIPMTKDSIPNHMDSARNALLNYVHESGNGDFLDGKLMFLSGSPELEYTNGIPTGRLSGIVNHHVPKYLRTNQKPSYQTNCIEDWEMKLDKVIDETLGQDMTLISGIPPWVQMYFDRIVERTGKPIKDVFPNFSVFVYGGVNFEPYRKKLFETIGKPVASIETYPASEGFIAFQDSQASEGLLLLTDTGIFYEFIPAADFYSDDPPRLTVGEVEVGVNYVVILTSNAGLWSYNLGDTIKFVSTYPHRILVTGRIKHFISAFGEHVIGEEVEKAMRMTMESFPEVELVEFTVAPQVTPSKGLPMHEWFVEFRQPPTDLTAFQNQLDLHLQKLNTYYFDLVSGNILSTLEIKTLHPGGFQTYMKSIGKLGGQNKVPRLSNDRNIANELEKYQLD
jgi:hypothetical protein